MKLALECRTKLLDIVQPFGDFDFILGHQVLQDKEYAEHYEKSERLKIVDNSVNEEGEPISIDSLEEAFGIVNGDLVISPDWLGERDRTLEAYAGCVQKFGEDKVIGVVQGKNYEEAITCGAVYRKWAAVPYDILSKKSDHPYLMCLRRALVIAGIPPTVTIHLLGFTSLQEFDFYKGRNNIWSIDTGAPILLGLLEKDILDPIQSKSDPTFNLMEDLELTQEKYLGIIRNIALLRTYIS